MNITNDLDSKPLLESIQKQLQNIGSKHEGTKNELVTPMEPHHTVNGLNKINEILIPFMDKNTIF
jgi:hypothetical protein